MAAMEETSLDLGFAQEAPNLTFHGFWDWFIKFNDPVELWRLQPTYMIAQVAFLVGGVVNLIHALKNGGRLPYLWLATVFHGIVVETVTYNLDDIDNFWHSQTPIILLGRRLPLHIITLYPVFIYHATIAVSRLKLPKWAEPCAVGLMVVLVDIPYDITSVKFLHWTWHDTDPNIYDRHYWVPWNSYYFHTCFAASFTFWFSLGREQKWKCGSFLQEVKNLVLASLLGMPGGVLLFLPLYHPLHDLGGVHSEVTFFILFTVFMAIIWSGDKCQKDNRPDVGTKLRWLMVLHLILHYGSFLGMVLFGNPEDEVSIGLHERTGPCNEMVPIRTAFGSVLQKRRYLCVTDYDESYFDFHCLPKGKLPAFNASWYTACGTPFENRTEYIAVIGTICFLATIMFWNFHIRNTQKTDMKQKKNK